MKRYKKPNLSFGLKWKLVLTVFTLLSLSQPARAQSANPQFEKFKTAFIESYWKIYPVEALYAGYYSYDSILTVYDAAFFEMRRSTLNELKERMNEIDASSLTANDRIDYKIISDRIEAGLWYLDIFREYEWNPSYYNLGGEFTQILHAKHAPLNARLKAISSRLRNVEQYFSVARSNLQKATLEHTELAIIQTEGSLTVFEKLIPDSVNTSTLTSHEKKSLNDRLSDAAENIQAYLVFLRQLKSGLNTDNTRGYSIGRTLYEQKFEYDLRSGYTADQIYEIAIARKDELHTSMAELARQLWPKYLGKQPMPDDNAEVIRLVIGSISENHTSADEFITTIEKQIPELEKFVRVKKLLDLDPTKPLVVRRTPAYMEGGGAGASISAPGPYEKDGKTYYNVSPLTNYSPEMAESYLKEYNDYTLQILNIHEAIPGHYAQLVYANKTPRIIRSILENGAMIEGWAVYAERMMLEEGYGDNKPEMWLMYYKWHLRSVCNTILDYSVHVLGWPEKVAMNFLIRDAFQEQAEAEGKWRRAKLTQVQLCSYFTGYTEIYEFREELKSLAGDQFNLKQFHEKFLSYGSAPVKYIKELMSEGE